MVEAATAKDLLEKVAVVVGGTQNIGAEITATLAARGATVIASYAHDEDAAQQLTDRFDSRVEAVKADATVGSDVDRLFEHACSRHGKVDVVVHLPGAVRKGPLAETSEDDFEYLFDLNTRSAFLTMRAAARRISDGGCIVVLSTTLTAVTTGLYGLYAGSKAAVEQMVKALSQELGERGITVNAVAPGPIDTKFFYGAETAESVDFFTHANPRGRLGQPSDVAPVIGFLTSPDAGWVNGQIIRINGGMF